ncbi:hypothetical protein PTTG_03647 [Puccinia triticina 1-1 BBBD Race 1]|uniref:Uncharacterized protein n=1 Tax=Puccinia triticina (isolate 1-1 / race 1 (BBBD)) TaxID=630390 RepID=A0A180GS04_PUCT1|nr:hypothetical protein PTTG_03647 [Puccinia triticina 1-1 BBBD Race 1]
MHWTEVQEAWSEVHRLSPEANAQLPLNHPKSPALEVTGTCLTSPSLQVNKMNADPKFVAQTKEALAKIQKHWERVKPKGTAILMANLQDTTWTQFWRDFAVALGKTVTHLGNLVDSMDAVGLVNWHVTIKKHGTYGVGRAPVISPEAEFRKPQRPGSMANPCKTAKERETERSQQESLAMAFGSGDIRLALERTKTRVTRNPHADVDAQERVQTVQELHEYHRATLAILHNTPNVEPDHPPRTDQFISEKRTVHTLAELAGQVSNQLAGHRRAGSPTPAPGGPVIRPKQTQRAPTRPASNSPATRAPGGPSKAPNPPTRLSAAAPYPAGNSAVFGSISWAPETKMTWPDMAAQASTRISVPKPAGAAVLLDLDPPSRPVQARSGGALQPGSGFSPSKAFGQRITPHAAHPSAPVPTVQMYTPTWKVTSKSTAPPTPWTSTPTGSSARTPQLEINSALSRLCRHILPAPPSLASTNIEVVLPTILSRGPNQGVHQSPARKVARSPHGEGIAHTIS